MTNGARRLVHADWRMGHEASWAWGKEQRPMSCTTGWSMGACMALASMFRVSNSSRAAAVRRARPSEGACSSRSAPRGVQGVPARSGRADRDDARHGGFVAGADADSQCSCRSAERGGLGVAERLGAAVDADADAWRPGGLTTGPVSDSEVAPSTGGGGGGGWLGERARPGTLLMPGLLVNRRRATVDLARVGHIDIGCSKALQQGH